MVIGNMGTEQKMNYTMMGNNVNLAARLEGVNKFYKSKILVSEATWNAANTGEHEGILLARKLDRVRVVGITTPVQLYNIVGVKTELPNVAIESVRIFNESIDLYLKKDFINAAKGFVEAQKLYPEDETPSVFVERCKQYYTNGVPSDWDGVVNMTSK
jgi:TolA-binding protein